MKTYKVELKDKNGNVVLKHNLLAKSNKDVENLMSSPNNGNTLVSGSTGIKIEISKCLCGYGYTPFFITCRSHKIKRAYDYFNTLKDLKTYYKIAKVIKTGRTEWAISSKGTKYEWPVYEAYISEEYVM